MVDKKDLLALVQKLHLPEKIKRDVIEHIDEIDPNELLNVLENYTASINQSTQKDQQALIEYQSAVLRFIELKEKEEATDEVFDLI